MRRLQSFITIDFETRLRPCRMAVCADGENDSLTDCFQVNMNKSMKLFRQTITLNMPLAQRFSENQTLKTSNCPAKAKSFSKESNRPTATAELLEQRLFERLRLHWLAQPGTLSAPP